MPVGYSIYIEKPSYIHQRVDPRTKLAVLGTVFVLALCFNNPIYLAAFLIIVIALGVWAQIPLKSFQMYLLFSIWFLFLGIVIWPFYIHQGPVVLRLGGEQFTSDGLLFGVAMGLRVALMITTAGIWMMATSPQHMTLGLLRMGLPYKAGMAMSATIRFVPLINAERATIMEAQRARGLDLSRGNPFQRVTRSVAVIGPMLVRALDLAQSLALAMESRAFGARDSRTSITEINFTKLDRVVMLICILLIVAAIVLRIFGIGILISSYL
ncbi:MAG TPA: energy-coupling factor transporter transmembrane component T [Ktedonobacteraceae bacterium]|jgi:energy-coupling factor transport system permease protein|nr:energy-coupling factor transporter transmembrane component T [Ktedonobacteraceae bacterium]